MPEPTARLPFSVMAKPVGAVCNLACRYCYYLKDEPDRRQVMSDEVLEKYVASYIAANEEEEIGFTWHGGEPTLAGLDFYKKVLALQKKYLPEGRRCWNNLQTNGLLLDDEWCAFLADNGFSVGLSIDGTRDVHDRYRVNAAGAPSYAQALAAAERLKKHGIKPDLLCTVTADTAAAPHEVYRSLRAMDTGWIQFIPIVRRDGSGVITQDSVSPEDYGRFLCTVFDEWTARDLGKTNVQLFAETALVLSGGKSGVCMMQPECGRVPVVEKDGSVYSCDHFVDEAHLLGNLMETPLEVLADSEAQLSFGKRKSELTCECRACPYLSLCYGGCLKDRFAKSRDGEDGQYYLCAGLRRFYDHAVPILRQMMAWSRQKVPSGEIAARIRAKQKELWKTVGRNDPCPCGSGKKAKSCCWPYRP